MIISPRLRRYHRQKLHLILSALRHRAAELAGSATFVQTDTYTDALRQLGEPVRVYQPSRTPPPPGPSASTAHGCSW